MHETMSLGFSVVSQPRYAPSGIASRFKGFSLRGTLFAGLIVALAVLLGLPALAETGHRTAAVATAQPAQPVHAAAAPDDALVELAGLKPSTISTAQPGVPGKPKLVPVSNDGLLGPAGETGELGIPTMVLRAYKLSAAELAKEQPSCRLPWWLLAGIGHTESGHAEGGRLYPDGTTRGRILGPRLNGGIAGDAVISDTDHGQYDGDPVYDRAVGPMQFIPSTWKTWGADGNHDGKRDPNNIYDATLAAGRYLCADGRDLATTAGLQAAVLSYNHSQAYLDTVLAWGYAYRSGASSLPDQTTPVAGDVTTVRPPLNSRPPHKPVRITPKPKPTPTRSGTPTASPTHSGSPTHSAVPSGSTSSTGSASSSPTCTATPTGSATATGSGSVAKSNSTSVPADTASAAARSSADGNSAAVSTSTSGTSTASTSSASTSPSCSR